MTSCSDTFHIVLAFYAAFGIARAQSLTRHTAL
jgi:hypothetical protein